MSETDDLHTLTGAYALNALPDDERERFEEHLTVCGPCADELAGFQAAAAGLGELAYEPPPPALRDQVLAAIGGIEQAPATLTAGAPTDDTPTDDTPTDDAPTADTPASVTRLSDRRPASRWAIGVAGAAAAALVVAVAGLAVVVNDLSDQLSEAESDSTQLEQVLAAPDASTVTAEGPAGATGRVVASPAMGEAVLLTSDLEPPPQGRTYEAWLIDDGFTSVGVFDPAEDGQATHLMAGDLERTAAIGVTVEPEGGSEQPTTDPVMVFELG